MLKVLHIVASMDPKRGGVSQAVRNIIFENNFSLHEVLCMDDENDQYGLRDSFTIHKVGTGVTGFQYNSLVTKWLMSNIKKYNHIIVHGIWQYHNYATYRAVRKLRFTLKLAIKVSVMPHGMLDPYFQKDKGRKMKAIRNMLIWHLTEKNAINSADAVLFTCEQELLLARETFNGYKPKREFNVGLGVLMPPVESPDMHFAFQSIVGGNVEPYWLFLSRLHSKKGVDLLINSYIKLNDENPDMPRLVIAGPIESDFAKRMVHLAKDYPSIKFTGMITGDAKWGAIYGCEMFILPSHQENFGIAVVEAIACGKPVAITDKVNIYNIIRDTNSGFIFKDDIEGTQSVLNKILACESTKFTELSQNGKLAYFNNYLPETAAKNFIAALEKL